MNITGRAVMCCDVLASRVSACSVANSAVMACCGQSRPGENHIHNG